MNVRTRQRKEELLRLVDLIERLPVEVEINTAMRILKPGAPCPCCGQPIKEGLPTETIMLLSWLQEGKDLSATTKGVKDETTDH